MQGLILILALLAALAVLGSGAPRWLRGPLALAALGQGVALRRREARRAPLHFVLPGGSGAAQVEGRQVSELRLRRRGPLTVLAWREPAGAWQRRCFWPDTLSPQARRELTLAAGDWRVSRSRRSMAP